jgi:hypothetical protein
MSEWEGFVFRAIPAVLAAVCIGFGIFIWLHADTPGDLVAGHVVTFLGAICLCLYATACTIILQLLNRYTLFDKIVYPIFSALVAGATMAFGIQLMARATRPPEVVGGFVVLGLGLICASVTLVVLSSTQFAMIPKNSKLPYSSAPLKGVYPTITSATLIGLPMLIAAAAWALGIWMLARASAPDHFVGGHVMLGLACITTSLIGLTHSVFRQATNTQTLTETKLWPAVALAMGAFAIIYGVVLICVDAAGYYFAAGLVMIGLGLICWSIVSKVALLSLVWRRSFKFANRIPMIPIFTALACLFLSSFVFELGVDSSAFFIPARVLVGLGAICFSLFSIVSILESGTS